MFTAIASTNFWGALHLQQTQQHHESTTNRISTQGVATIKGWLAALGLWLVGTLVFVILSDTTRAKEPGTYYSSNVEWWPLLAVGSVFVSLFVGVPLALLVAHLLRSVSSRWIQVFSFFAVFTLLPAILFTVFSPESWLSALVFSTPLGCCVAFGRVAAFGSGWG